jgi:uncharacterized alpha-E superfamily protein
MLSRSAERLYWLARYLERTENTARLLSVSMNMMFDLPSEVEMSWNNLLNIFGAEAKFYELYSTPDEYSSMRFLLIDPDHSGSIYCSLQSARETIRTCRDLMPDETWEQVNEMYLFVTNNVENISTRRGRMLLMNEIMEGCQRFTGFLYGAMSRNDAFHFIQLGRNIERADMTTRILDACPVLLADNRSDKMRQYENNLWMHVLRSLSALLMYRKHRRLRIKSGDVLDYLLKDEDFPRSVLHCLNQIRYCINQLPRSEALLDNLSTLENFIIGINNQNPTPAQLHQLLDYIQARLGVTHNQIAETWFLSSRLT